MLALTKLLNVSILGIALAVTAGLLVNLFTSGDADAYVYGIAAFGVATAFLIPMLIARAYIDTTYEAMRRMEGNQNTDPDEILRAAISHRKIVPFLIIAGTIFWLLATILGAWWTYQKGESRKAFSTIREGDLERRLDFVVRQLCENPTSASGTDRGLDEICADSRRRQAERR